MMSPEERYPHLSEEAAIMAEQPNEQRITYIMRDRFILHAQAEAFLDELNLLYGMDDAVRSQGRLLVGPSLMGKSTLLEEFLLRHPADDNPDGNAAIVPVVLIQYPETASEGIYPEILARLNARLPVNAKPSYLRRASVDLLRQVGMRILIIDEMHNLLEGSPKAQRKGLNSIKYLMNALHRPVVVAGTVEAFNAVRSDVQIRSRLRPMPLERFKDDESFQKLLHCFELLLPLRKPSCLIDPLLSSLIFQHTLGIIGNVSDLLNKSAIYAIKAGGECITAEAINANKWGFENDETLKDKLK